MPTYSCLCSELICRCYCGRQWTKVTHLKKLKILPTLVGASKAPPSSLSVSITLCSYMLKAAAEGAQTIQILSDDTDVLVLLVYWTSRMRVAAKIQMEKWNGDVLDINEIVRQLGPRTCSQLLGNHALSGCDTVSYSFGKGKLSALKLLEIGIPGLDQVLGQPGVTQTQLQETASTFFLPLYGQKELYNNE